MLVYRINKDGECITHDFGNGKYNTDVWKDASVLTKDDDGQCYQFYLEDGQPDLVAIGEATMVATAQEAVSYITALVQARIDQYNKDHNLAFDNVKGMVAYTRRSTYSHLQFANDVLDWNEDVWEEANLIKAQVLSGEIPQPTPEEFAAMLPEYTGVI